jgi:predicted transcriptional regulator
MKVRDIMTSPVISVAPDSTVLEAVRIMLQRHISGLPVVEKGGELVGIVTEGDFLGRAGWNIWWDPAGLRMNTPAPMGARSTRS